MCVKNYLSHTTDRLENFEVSQQMALKLCTLPISNTVAFTVLFHLQPLWEQQIPRVLNLERKILHNSKSKLCLNFRTERAGIFNANTCQRRLFQMLATTKANKFCTM